MPGGRAARAASIEAGSSGGSADVNGTATASTTSAARAPPPTTSRSRRSTGVRRPTRSWSGPASSGAIIAAATGTVRSEYTANARASATSTTSVHGVAPPSPHREAGEDEQERQRAVLPARPVRRAPLREVLGARPDRGHRGVELGTDRRQCRDDGRGDRHHGCSDQQAPRGPVERQAEHRCGADHEGDRPHPVQHRPDPDERDQPPADPSVACGAEPGADHDRDQQIADHLRSHREPVLHRPGARWRSARRRPAARRGRGTRRRA